MHHAGTPQTTDSLFTSVLSMEQGTVARKMDKGFGFIRPENGDKDLFFHANELVNIDFNSIQEGDRVEYEVTEGQKGPQASKVSKI
jgi:cold shock protein